MKLEQHNMTNIQLVRSLSISLSLPLPLFRARALSLFAGETVKKKEREILNTLQIVSIVKDNFFAIVEPDS